MYIFKARQKKSDGNLFDLFQKLYINKTIRYI